VSDGLFGRVAPKDRGLPASYAGIIGAALVAPVVVVASVVVVVVSPPHLLTAHRIDFRFVPSGPELELPAKKARLDGDPKISLNHSLDGCRGR